MTFRAPPCIIAYESALFGVTKFSETRLYFEIDNVAAIFTAFDSISI